VESHGPTDRKVDLALASNKNQTNNIANNINDEYLAHSDKLAISPKVNHQCVLFVSTAFQLK
jgi:hypothetical protein